MKKTVYRSLILLSLLSGFIYAAAQGSQAALPCEDSPVPVPCVEVATQASNLAPITQLADIVGVWRLYVPAANPSTPNRMAYQHIHSDGSSSQADTLENTTAPYEGWPHGSYIFEGGVLLLTLDGQASQDCETGRFEARLYRYGAQPVALLLTPIEDSCSGLGGGLPLVWVAPAD